MEEHFLSHQVEGEPEFVARPWYNPVGDCIIFKLANEASVADRVDDVLTIYRSAIDDRPIGYQIKDVLALIRMLGMDALSCVSRHDSHKIVSVSVTALLLAAYEQRPPSIGRRFGYACAFDASSAIDEPLAISSDDFALTN